MLSYYTRRGIGKYIKSQNGSYAALYKNAKSLDSDADRHADRHAGWPNLGII